MSARSKVYSSFDDAVRDIPDGATLGFGGFAVVGMPINLYQAVAKQGAKNLTCVSNSTRGGATLPADAPDMGQMIQNGQVKKVICAFTAPTRASQRLILSEYVDKGLIEAELVPQGTLAERMRAAGAGIPAFYTPAAVGTELAEGRETRMFNGREYLLEHALPLDYAFIRAYQADAAGNLRFRRSQRNFNPIMAMAARVTVVEVEEDILPVGAIDPDDVHTAGVFVHRLVKIPPPPEGWWPQRPGSSGDEREGERVDPPANVRPAGDGVRRRLDRQSRDRHPDPVLEFRFRRQGDHLPFRERGDRLWAAGGAGQGGHAPRQCRRPARHAAARRGDRPPRRFLRADPQRPDRRDRARRLRGRRERRFRELEDGRQQGGGIGGAMDLAACAKHVFVAMEHQTRDGKPRLVERCAIPATARGVVNLVATNFGLFEVTPEGLALREIAPGVTVDEVRAATGCNLIVPGEVPTVRMAG